jgi:hypothetical protein
MPLAAIALLLCASVTPGAAADLWSTQFALPTLDGRVDASTNWNGKLVLGGQFERAGRVAGVHVVAWNGSAYEALGNGISTNVTLVGTNAGTLYAVANVRRTLWRWDGASWVAVTTLAGSSQILAITSHLGDLYIGGTFTSVGGVAATNIARFDGSNWSAVGSGTTGTVNALASYGGALYVGGAWLFGAGTGALYSWNGSTWSAPGGGVTSDPPGVQSLFADANGLVVAAGVITSVGGLPCLGGPARWNGTSWECLTLPSGSSGYNDRFANLGGDLVGTVEQTGTSTSRWNGSSWVSLGDGVQSSPTQALGVLGSDLYAFGELLNTSLPVASLYWQRWNGSTWSSPDPWEPDMRGVQGTIYELYPYAGTLLALGVFGQVGAGDHLDFPKGIASWDGSSWHPVGSGFVVPYDATSFQGNLVVGGFIHIAGPIDGVVRWNGSAWSGLGVGLTYPEQFNPYAEVYGVATYGSDLVACGEFTKSGATSVNGIARWNGSAWQPLGSGFDVLDEDVPLTMLADGTDLYVGGTFAAAGGVVARRIARWDGGAWHAVASGFADGEVHAFTKFGNEVIAGGTFSVAGGSPANGSARLRNGAWVPMGTNAIDVQDFDVHGGALYAAGKFLRQDLSTHLGLARWDGSAWEPLGASGVSGWNPTPYAVASFGDEIFLGGKFEFVDGIPSVNVAAYEGSPLVSVLPAHGSRVSFAAPRPNPARSSVDFTFVLPEPMHVRLVIHDLQGREVARLADGERAAGAQSLSWDGRLPGGREAIGVYQGVLETPEGRLVRKLIWIR